MHAIEAFLAAAESKSFSDAARKLGRTPAALSIQIKSLEEMSGQKLFHRATKGTDIKLTSAGRKYHQRVQSSVYRLQPVKVSQESPTTVAELDFDSSIQDSHPDLLKFWDDAKAVDFDLTKDKTRTHSLNNVSLSFREEGGQWVYNHIGRRTAYADFHGFEHCQEILGRNASLRQPSGRYDPYDYEVTKMYNKVAVTGEPSLSVVIGTVKNPDGAKRRVEYERIVIKVWDGDTDIVMVRVVLRNENQISELDKTTILPLEIDELGDFDQPLSEYLEVWQREQLWTSDSLKKYHDVSFVVRPVATFNDSMIISYIGENHGSTQQFGEEWRMNNMGALLDAFDPLGEEYVSETAQGYYECVRTGKPSLSLLYSKGKLRDGGESSIAYLRLLTRCFLSDGSPIVVNTASAVYRFDAPENMPKFFWDLLSRADRH